MFKILNAIDKLVHISSFNYRNGHIDISRYLIEKCKGSVDVTTDEGYTPLHLSCL